MATSWNVFRIGRERGQEDQLTEMLAWLADAVPEVAGALVSLAFPARATEPERFELTTQHGIVGGRLDLLLTSPSLVLVVESKLGSDYGDAQVRRYLEWLSASTGDRADVGLMTLTAREAPWPVDDVAYAEAQRITGSARRWEELHDLLESSLDDGASGELASRLVQEFLDMLAEEGLIPVRPLSAAELGTAWADSWSVVRRYRDFFHACKEHIGEALGAVPIRNSWSDRGDWVWQDYRFDDGVRIVVGLFCTDEFEKIAASATTRTPLVWMAVQADQIDDWLRVAAALETSPPPGWNAGKRWYGERPNVWRPLGPLLTGGTFDEQREQLAVAVAGARAWIDSVLAGPVEPAAFDGP
jgi:hypothetical protein